jgi:short-subunit dehydrogenase
MKKILIIGAASTIAECAAKIWAKEGSSFYLVARNRDRLSAITNELLGLGAAKVDKYVMDLTQYDEHNKMLIGAYEFLSEIDIVLIAHGNLSNQDECEKFPEFALKEINVNALSTVSILTSLANFFENQKHGMIAVISSVAGDRGRQKNYVYGSAKALLTTFTSGLRQRLQKSNIRVITIKPGFVDTTMTKNYKKGILWTKPDYVAFQIVKACSSKGGVIYTPKFWFIIMFIIKIIPESIYMKLKL